MIRFIYGESGFGKSHRVAELIKKDIENGIRTFLIVPDQEAVSSERKMLSLLPPSAQLSLEVLSFSRLYNRVCREYGGLQYNYLTRPAKQLIMWRTLRELSPMLEHYGSIFEGDSSTTDKMLGAIGELKANAISAHSLGRAADKLTDASLLSAKLRDLSLIYSAYSAFISEGYGDAADDISKLDDILREHDFFSGASVYIDSFTSYTTPEHSVIERIMSTAKSLTVTIPLSSEGAKTIYSESISYTERKLIESANGRGGYTTEVLTHNHRAKSPALAHLSRNLWNFGNDKAYDADDASSAIVLERCDTPYAEADAAARWVRHLMREGYRCRDIVVVCADANNYKGIIEPSFERNGIPYYLSEKSDLCAKSLLKFIISTFRIKKFGWRTTDVITHIKTGIYDLPLSDCDLFESYVTTWNIRSEGFMGDDWTMNPDGYSKGISERGIRILEAANTVRKRLCESLIPLFAELDAADSPKEMCQALYSFLVRVGAEERLFELGKKYLELGDVKQASEYSSLFEITLRAIATVAELLPEEKMSTGDFADALTCVFDTTEIGTIPTSVDEVVIGSASMLRASEPKCVIVLGLCEGEFPRPVSDTGLLNFTEKAKLSEVDISFSSNSESRASDELMFIQKTFSLPSELLILTTAEASADRSEKRPSLPYNRVKTLFPCIKEHIFDQTDVTYLTPSATDTARFAYIQEDISVKSSLSRALISHSDDFAYLSSGIAPAISEPSAKLSATTVSEAFPKNMTISQSRLEKYVKCAFSYCCSNVLSLREEKRAQFGLLDMGNFVHYLLENILKALLSDDGTLNIPSDDELKRLASALVSEYVGAILPEKERRSGKMRHLCQRLERLSVLLAKNILEEFAHSEFTPAFFELKIGRREGELPPLEFILNDGSRVSLSGIIDRVDIYRSGNEIFVRVVDYKTGSKSFSLDDLALGLNTQMLLYLFALCSKDRGSRILNTDLATVPSGVVYLSSNIPTIELETSEDEELTEKKAAAAFKRSGLLLSDEDVLKAMNDELSPAFLAGVKKNKSGELSGDSLVSLERFAELKVEIETVITDIILQMKSGRADAAPLIYKGDSPCDFCEMRPVCRVVENKNASDGYSDGEKG